MFSFGIAKAMHRMHPTAQVEGAQISTKLLSRCNIQ